MWKIVIQNPRSETVIHNVAHEELDFWTELLQGYVHGDIQYINVTEELAMNDETVSPHRVA